VRKLIPVLALGMLLAVGCGGSNGSGSTTSSAPRPQSGTLTVFAAASLTDSFNALGKQFEAAHPGVRVTFNYNGSSTLVQQITQGAPADVFASADQANMDKLVKAGMNGAAPQNFASNVLEIAVPPGNPKHITGFADLAKPGVTVVVCAPQVPCGSATQKVENASKVTLHPKSEEQDVKSVLAKVEANEADAGLVYVTDVTSAGTKVTGVPFPEADQALNVYPLVVVKESKQAALAAQFVAFVLGPQGRQELARDGFRAP